MNVKAMVRAQSLNKKIGLIWHTFLYFMSILKIKSDLGTNYHILLPVLTDKLGRIISQNHERN